LKIRSAWDNFCAGNPTALAARFPGQTVFTLPSSPIIRAPMYQNSTSVRIRYLTGSKERCFARAKKRSSLTRQYWEDNNRALLAYLRSGCPVEWKLAVFTDAGGDRTLAELARAVLPTA
jgi:hypothetical protein